MSQVPSVESLVPVGREIRCLILTTQPQLGPDVDFDPDTEHYVREQLEKCGLGHVGLICLKGLNVQVL